uniref:Uncharacterized protein n=1 Tax=Heliothis virescens TaxID=7102 RepID=A0A2A4J7E3_HELVI
MTAVPTNATADLGAEAHYTYDDGEHVDFNCEIVDFDNLIGLRLEYYNAQGGLIMRTSIRRTTGQKFRTVLKLEHDNYYFDCKGIPEISSVEYRYRVYFNLRKQDIDTSKPSLTLYVNGERQVLRHKQLDADYDDYRPYTYIQGEQLNVTCKKDKLVKGDILFYFNKKSKALYNSESERMLRIDSSEYPEFLLICMITKDLQKRMARISFKSVLPDWEPPQTAD